MKASSNAPGCETSVRRQFLVDREALDVLAQHARDQARRITRERAEVLLDEALGDTFPASDAIFITIGKPGSK